MATMKQFLSKIADALFNGRHLFEKEEQFYDGIFHDYKGIRWTSEMEKNMSEELGFDVCRNNVIFLYVPCADDKNSAKVYIKEFNHSTKKHGKPRGIVLTDHLLRPGPEQTEISQSPDFLIEINQWAQRQNVPVYYISRAILYKERNAD
jgi:hypothetical protein